VKREHLPDQGSKVADEIRAGLTERVDVDDGERHIFGLGHLPGPPGAFGQLHRVAGGHERGRHVGSEAGVWCYQQDPGFHGRCASRSAVRTVAILLGCSGGFQLSGSGGAPFAVLGRSTAERR
jgi:hypothetical protein